MKSSPVSIAATLTLAVPAVLFRAFVITRLWTWFAVPLGLIEITIAHALGLQVLVGFMLRSMVANKSDEPDPKWRLGIPKTMLEGVAHSVFALLVGWAIAEWMA